MLRIPLLLSALLLASLCACTPAGQHAVLPAVHADRPLDSGGGIPPHSAPAPTPAPTP